MQHWADEQAQHVYLQNKNAIDVSAYEYIELSYWQAYRRFTSTKTYIDYSTDNGTTWTSVEVNGELGSNGGTAGEKKHILYANNALQFFIRFRWDDRVIPQNGSGYGWIIDDVSINSLADIDLAYQYGRVHTETYQYSQIPKLQRTDIKVEAYVSNYGTTPLTNVKLVLSGGDIAGESEAIDIPFQTSDTLLLASFVPSETVGTHTLERSFTMDQSPDDENNTLSDFSFEITDSIYAIDRAPYTKMVWHPFVDKSITMLGVGASFDIFADQTLSAVDLKVDPSSTPEGQLSVELWKYDATATESAGMWGSGPLVTTEWTLGTASTDVFHTVPFPSPILLEANSTYLLLVATPDTTKIALSQGGASPSNLSRQQYFRTSKSETITWYGSNGRPALRMHFGKVLPCVIDQTIPNVCVGSTLTLASEQLPGGVWSSSDETIATVNPTTGVVKGLIADTTVTISYGGGTASCTTPATKVITINKCADQNTGINDLETISTVTLFPNPTNDQVNVQFELQQTTEVVVELTDLSGRIIYSTTLNNLSVGKNNATIDLSAYNNGIYMLALRTDNVQHVSKLIKK